FVFANQWEPSYFFHNESPNPGAFLGLHLLLPVGAAPVSLVERTGHPRDTPGRPAIGATATVRLPNGHKLIGQIDGGSGHSGRRSPDIHLGLGNIAKGQRLPVELKWRDINGRIQTSTLQLEPGWHTVRLGSAKGAMEAIR